MQQSKSVISNQAMAACCRAVNDTVCDGEASLQHLLCDNEANFQDWNNLIEINPTLKLNLELRMTLESKKRKRKCIDVQQ